MLSYRSPYQPSTLAETWLLATKRGNLQHDADICMGLGVLGQEA